MNGHVDNRKLDDWYNLTRNLNLNLNLNTELDKLKNIVKKETNNDF